MAQKRVILELGTGNDLHGGDYTKAALRAVQDALHHSSLSFIRSLNIDKSKLERWAKAIGWETLLNRAGTSLRRLAEANWPSALPEPSAGGVSALNSRPFSRRAILTFCA